VVEALHRSDASRSGKKRYAVVSGRGREGTGEELGSNDDRTAANAAVVRSLSFVAPNVRHLDSFVLFSPSTADSVHGRSDSSKRTLVISVKRSECRVTRTVDRPKACTVGAININPLQVVVGEIAAAVSPVRGCFVEPWTADGRTDGLLKERHCSTQSLKATGPEDGDALIDGIGTGAFGVEWSGVGGVGWGGVGWGESRLTDKRQLTVAIELLTAIEPSTSSQRPVRSRSVAVLKLQRRRAYPSTPPRPPPPQSPASGRR
jgi:hypothetical protein